MWGLLLKIYICNCKYKDFNDCIYFLVIILRVTMFDIAKNVSAACTPARSQMEAPRSLWNWYLSSEKKTSRPFRGLRSKHVTRKMVFLDPPSKYVTLFPFLFQSPSFVSFMKKWPTMAWNRRFFLYILVLKGTLMQVWKSPYRLVYM